MTRTPSNGSAVLLSRVSVCITLPVYCTAIGGSSGDVIVHTDYTKHSPYRLYKIWYKYTFYFNFDTVLNHFSRQEHQIDVLYVSFNTWDSQVSSYTPFHFSFTVPLSICKKAGLKEGSTWSSFEHIFNLNCYCLARFKRFQLYLTYS